MARHKHLRIRDHDIVCNKALMRAKRLPDVRKPNGKKKRQYKFYPDLRLKCSKCGSKPVVVGVTVQTSWFRGEDEQFYLCQSCYDETGAKPLPTKASSASNHEREEALLKVFSTLGKLG